MALNKVMLIGNVGKKPEVKYIDQNTKVARFSVATTERYTKNGEQKEITEWHRVVAWRGNADVIEKYVDAGQQVYVEGRLKTTQYQKDGQTKDQTEIVVERIQLLGKRSESGSQTATRPASASVQQPTFEEPTDGFPF